MIIVAFLVFHATQNAIEKDLYIFFNQDQLPPKFK